MENSTAGRFAPEAAIRQYLRANTLIAEKLIRRQRQVPDAQTRRVENRIGNGGSRADEFEDITVREIALSELAQLVDKGLLTDTKSFLLVQTLRLRRPDLFD